MMYVIRRLLSRPLVLIAASVAAMPASADNLVLSPDTPVVSVSTRPAGRNFMRLPNLEYAFRIEAHCSADDSPKSVSLSIADTRISLGTDSLANEGPIEISVEIPAGQIGPVATSDFCVVGASGNERLRIASVLSAQASMLCGEDDDGTMTYASAALDVVVDCEAAPAAQ